MCASIEAASIAIAPLGDKGLLLQNRRDCRHCCGLSSRAESGAVNHPIIKEFAPHFHHILANLDIRLLCNATPACAPKACLRAYTLRLWDSSIIPHDPRLNFDSFCLKHDPIRLTHSLTGSE
jgi:hypothetical protein